MILKNRIKNLKEARNLAQNIQNADNQRERRKVNLADFVIYNDGEQALIPQVMNIHRQLST